MSAGFTLDLSKFKTKVGVRTDAVLRRVAFEAFSSVIRKTPVDTGRARANWIPMIGELPAGQIGMAANGHSLAAASAVVKKFTAGQIIYLGNNLPYIMPLEDGSSTQAPGGMVYITMLELQAKFDALVAGAVQATP